MAMHSLCSSNFQSVHEIQVSKGSTLYCRNIHKTEVQVSICHEIRPYITTSRLSLMPDSKCMHKVYAYYVEM